VLPATQDLAKAVWSLAKVGYKRPKLLRKLAEQAAVLSSQLNAQDIATILWAFGSLTYHPGNELLETLASAAANQLDHFQPQACLLHQMIASSHVPAN
jgi:hypothetical protein